MPGPVRMVKYINTDGRITAIEQQANGVRAINKKLLWSPYSQCHSFQYIWFEVSLRILQRQHNMICHHDKIMNSLQYLNLMLMYLLQYSHSCLSHTCYTNNVQCIKLVKLQVCCEQATMIYIYRSKNGR